MENESKTPYLAPSLQQEGFTGVTGSTPYKPVSPKHDLWREARPKSQIDSRSRQ
jgi:hypothetical protein